MILRSQQRDLQQRAARLCEKAGVVLTEEERARIEVADFGLGFPEREGAQIFTFVQTNRYAAKIIALLPGQSLPEHWHPPVGDDPGKQETIRVAWGTLFVGVAGPRVALHGRIPAGKEAFYTLRYEVVLGPAGSRTFDPGEKHWFQGGPEGVLVYSFSSVVRDVRDGFTDPAVERITRIQED